MRTRAMLATTALLGAGLLTGCGPKAEDLPLPGTTVEGKSFLMTAEFADALNLARGAKVKVNGIDVGRVKEVESEDFHAVAVLRVKQDADIHRGATARLRYTTPLGELFVDIRSPLSGPVLGEGDTMKPPQTSTAPTVEDALASASLLINGGGLEQLQTITTEFQKAVGGRGPTIRQLLDRTSAFLTQANATTVDIDRALRALDGASKVLNDRQVVINRAVREFTPAARIIRQHTGEAVALLQQLVTLGKKANTLVGSTRTQLLGTVRQLGPVLQTFYSLRDRFGAGLQALANGANALDGVIEGDWAPVTLFSDLGDLSGVIPGVGGLPAALPTSPTLVPGLGLPTLLPGLGLRAAPDAGRGGSR